MLENTVLHPRKVFSRIGLSLFVYTIVVLFLSTVIQVFCLLLFPKVYESAYFIWGLTVFTQYIVGFPVIRLVLIGLPKYRYTPEKIKFIDFLGLITLSVGLGQIGSFIGNIINAVITFITQKEQVNPVSEMLEKTPLWVAFVVTVFFAPIVEEFIFRRFIIDRTRIYGDLTAILFSGIAFGAFHGNISQFFYAALLGVLFAYVYIRTKNITYPILLHAVFNFFMGFVPLCIQKQVPIETINLETPGVEDILNYLPYIVFSLVAWGITIIGVIYFFIRLKKIVLYTNQFCIQKGKVFLYVCVNVGVILFAVICLFQVVLNIFA